MSLAPGTEDKEAVRVGVVAVAGRSSRFQLLVGDENRVLARYQSNAEWFVGVLIVVDRSDDCTTHFALKDDRGDVNVFAEHNWKNRDPRNPKNRPIHFRATKKSAGVVCRCEGRQKTPATLRFVPD